MRGKDILGFLNLVIIAGVLGAISYAALVLQPAEYDPETLCLTGVTPPHTAVVIDKTDLYTAEQAYRIQSLVLGARDRLDVGEKLSLYELDARGELVNTNRFALCNPGRGDQINPLYRNPQRVEARYQARFEAPLQDALADLVEPKESPASPIIEALARLATEDGFDRDTPGRTVVLVSDMLQNSQAFSVYGRWQGDLAARLPAPYRVADAVRAEYGDALAGVTIEIYVIPRPGWEADQQTLLPAYWDEIFRQLGVATRWTAL